MSNGPIPLRYVEEAGERRASDRRASDRRAPRRWLDPLFAATLVNQVAPGEMRHGPVYGARTKAPHPGIVVNLRA